MNANSETHRPWKAVKQSGRFLIVSADESTHIATVKGDSDTQGADAALIAAAPDLLEALESLLAEKDESYPIVSEERRKAAHAVDMARGYTVS